MEVKGKINREVGSWVSLLVSTEDWLFQCFHGAWSSSRPFSTFRHHGPLILGHEVVALMFLGVLEFFSARRVLTSSRSIT